MRDVLTPQQAVTIDAEDMTWHDDAQSGGPGACRCR